MRFVRFSSPCVLPPLPPLQLVVASNTTYAGTVGSGSPSFHSTIPMKNTRQAGGRNRWIYFIISLLHQYVSLRSIVNHTQGFPSSGSALYHDDGGSWVFAGPVILSSPKHGMAGWSGSIVGYPIRVAAVPIKRVSMSRTRMNEEHGPALVNDGSGLADVSVPSFLIYKKNIADKIKGTQERSVRLIGTLRGDAQRFCVPAVKKEDDSSNSLASRVVSSLDHNSRHVMDIAITPTYFCVAVILRNRHTFHPFSLIQSPSFQCTSGTRKMSLRSLCTNHSRYCAIHARELSGHMLSRKPCAMYLETLR
jgi:hypothetical protein